MTSPETPYSEVKDGDYHADTTLVTRFAAPDGRTCLMVVNCDYRKERTIHVESPFVAEKFDPATEKWTPVGSSFDLALVRGGGVILRGTDRPI